MEIFRFIIVAVVFGLVSWMVGLLLYHVFESLYLFIKSKFK